MQPIIDNILLKTTDSSTFPRFNIMDEDAGSFIIELAAPGYALNEISKSTSTDGDLVISGNQPEETRPHSHMGIPSTFSRTFPMLDINAVTVELTSVANGFLTITITNNV